MFEYAIKGNDIQFVEITLAPGQTTIGETGAMMFMEEGIQMQTKLSDGSEAGSGLLGSLVGAAKRKLAGENSFLGHFTNNHANKNHSVTFSAPFPGHIIPVDLNDLGTPILAQKGAFLCCAEGISVGIGYTKRLGAGWMGGEGFILQKIEGRGTAFIHAGGSVETRTLAENETIYVDTGSIVAFQQTVDFDIQMISGIRNVMFGNEDMFLSTLTGPGKVWIQSMPYYRLVNTIGYILAGGDKNKRP